MWEWITKITKMYVKDVIAVTQEVGCYCCDREVGCHCGDKE